MSMFQKTMIFITIFGAFVLGVLGLFSFNLIAFLFGDMTVLTRILYTIIGISGIIAISSLLKSKDYPYSR